MSDTCCGSMGEDSDQEEEEEEEELMGHPAPEAGDSDGEEPPIQATEVEPTGVPGANVDGDDGQESSNQTTAGTSAEEVPACRVRRRARRRPRAADLGRGGWRRRRDHNARARDAHVRLG